MHGTQDYMYVCLKVQNNVKNETTIMVKRVGKAATFYLLSPSAWLNVAQKANVCVHYCSVIFQH